jgi:hypothetical protein
MHSACNAQVKYTNILQNWLQPTHEGVLENKINQMSGEERTKGLKKIN